MHRSLRYLLIVVSILIAIHISTPAIRLLNVITALQTPDVAKIITTFLNLFSNGPQPAWVLDNTRRHTFFTTQKTPESEYDYIVVGAGTAGCVVAGRLSENPNVKVLLIEAGGPENIFNDPPGHFALLTGSGMDWSFVTEPQNNAFINSVGQQSHWERGRAMGGSSAVNGLVYMRGVASDYNNWVRLGAANWSYAENLPFFMLSERNTNAKFVANGLHGTRGPLPVTDNYADNADLSSATMIDAAVELGFKKIDLNGPTGVGTNNAQQAIEFGNRMSTSAGFIEPIAHLRPNLDVMVSSYVTRVLFSPNKAAEAVQFVRFGEKFTVRAKREIVLSAGALQSPHILLLSGVGPREQLTKFNIPLVTDLPGVGRNLIDHPYAYGAAFTYPSAGPARFSIESMLQYQFNRTGPLQYVDHPICTANSSINYDFDWPDIQLSMSSIDSDGLNGIVWPIQAFRIRPDVLNRMYVPYLSPKWAAFVMIAVVSRPRSRGYLELRSADPFQFPKIQPNYLAATDDVQILVDALRWHYRMAQTNAFINFGARLIPSLVVGCEQLFSLVRDPQYHRFLVPNDRYLECQGRHMTIAGLHPVGTCKMGAVSDRLAVVNPQLQVLGGISRLRVIDSSIMPMITDANTNAPTVMIGERGAQFIIDDFNFNIKY